MSRMKLENTDKKFIFLFNIQEQVSVEKKVTHSQTHISYNVYN